MVIENMQDSASTSSSSRISANSMRIILDKLKTSCRRKSTNMNYIGIWRSFNSFIIRLDSMPESWEDRISLFMAFLVNDGKQSSTVRSYYCAIKAILFDDGYKVNDNKVLLNTLAKACRIINDRVRTRLPIRVKLLEILLFEIQRLFDNQPYLEVMYKAIFLLGYYGLMRIGELTTGSHPIKASNVHIAQNKNKILIVLYSSKTHGKESRPQRIKITANEKGCKGFFCPFRISRKYLEMRGDYFSDDDPFFIFKDQTPVPPKHVRAVLKSAQTR